MTSKEMNKKLVVPMTQGACDACSQSGDFLDVLLTQTFGSHVLNLVPEDERGKYPPPLRRRFWAFSRMVS
jgi:hypothetical protein